MLVDLEMHECFDSSINEEAVGLRQLENRSVPSELPSARFISYRV